MSILNYRSGSEVWVDASKYLDNPPLGIPCRWWPKLYNLMGGFRPHELTLLCAPTGSGKTEWLANLAAQFVLDKVPLFVAPVETGDADFAIRVAGALKARNYNAGERIPPMEREDLDTYMAPFLKNTVFNISSYDNRVNIEEMINLLLYMYETYGVKVALLDNLNFFLNITGKNMEVAEMDYAIHEFVMLVKKIGIHIILVVHPRKTEEGRVESEFDIKGSSTAVQETQNVVLFNRPTKKDVENSTRSIHDRQFTFRKLRKRGHNVGKSVWFQFNNGRYEEYKDGK